MRRMTLLMVIGVSFGLGYYVGQHPTEVKQKVQDISGELIEKTIGVGSNPQLLVQREFLEAKASLLEGKLHLLNQDYQRAAQQLEDALHHLTNALKIETEGVQSRRIHDVRDAVKDLQDRMARGEVLSPEQLDEVQRQIEAIRS